MFPTTMAIMACHQDNPKGINELPVMYVEMLQLMSTPRYKSSQPLDCTENASSEGMND